MHRKVLDEILAFCAANGFSIAGLVRSAVRGPKGNVEFLVHLRLPAGEAQEGRIGELIERVMAQA